MNLIAPPIFPHITEEQTASLMEAFTKLQELARTSLTRIAIKLKGKILLLEPGDVVAVVAEGNYVSLQLESNSYLLRESISAMAKKLEPFGFVRIHRSMIVNSSFVKEIKSYSTGEYGLRVKGGKEYTVTRTYKENLKSLAEFWIGTGQSGFLEQLSHHRVGREDQVLAPLLSLAGGRQRPPFFARCKPDESARSRGVERLVVCAPET